MSNRGSGEYEQQLGRCRDLAAYLRRNSDRRSSEVGV